MAIATNYYMGYDTATTTSATSSWTTIHGSPGIYEYDMYRGVFINEPTVPAKPNKKTFEEKLQCEIDNWLSEFD